MLKRDLTSLAAATTAVALVLVLLHSVATKGEPARTSAMPAPTPTATPTPTPPTVCVNHDQEVCIQVRIGVMAPQIVADTFGKRIAENFVAVQVTVGNHDKDFQYLINDVSLWFEANKIFTPVQPAPSFRAPNSPAAAPSDFFFSSAELSLLRGVAERGQGQDRRNKTLRFFRGIGTIAAGLIGVASFGPSYPKSVAIFNGPVINAFSEAFPDYTINQMNRLSDSAYTANTLVPAKHSKVMVAFIPQAIFMSRAQRKLFWDEPTALYPDPVSGNCTTEGIKQCVDFRRITVYVDGDFITEVSNMAPTVSDVQFEDSERQKFETEKPVVKGRVVGRFLTGTSIDVENVPQGLSISKDGEPTADRLNFIIKANKPVPPNTSVTFVISNAQGSQRVLKEIRYMPGPPTLNSVDPATAKQGSTSVIVTLTGTNFIPGRTRVLVSGGGVDVSDPTDVAGTSMKVKITVAPDAATTPRNLTVVNDNSESSPKTFTIAPKAANP